MIKLKELISEGKLQQAMRQWKNVEDYLNPKQKKFIKKHYNSMKSKFKYFKPEDYADYIEGELDVKVPPQEFNNKKAIEFGQLVLAYSGAIKEPRYYNEGILKEGPDYVVKIEDGSGKLIQRGSYTFKEDAKLYIKDMVKKHKLKRQKGFWGNSNTGVELSTNF